MSAKRSKQYKQMIKQHSKVLVTDAKAARPWAWEYGLEMFIEHLRFMKDYYTLDENVWGEDKENKRLTTLTEALDEYDAWQNCEDKYFIHHETGGKENERGVPFQNEDGTITRSDWWIEYAYDNNYKATIKAFNKEYKEHREKFFKIVAKNIENWSD